MTTAERSSSGEKSASPIAFAPSRHARPSAAWRAKAASSPSSSRSPSARIERGDEGDRRRERRRAGRERVAELRPVEVEARERRARASLPRRRRDGDEREPRRRHQRLLRAGDDDVESPRVRLERHRAEARDRVDHRERARLAGRGRQRLDVRDDARRRLRVHEERDLRARLLEPRAHVVGLRRLAPRVAQLLHVGAVRAGDRDPAVAELARRDAEHALAGREQVHDRGLERGRARRGEEQDVGARPADLRRRARQRVIELAEVRARDGGGRARRRPRAPPAEPASAPAPSGSACPPSARSLASGRK